MKKLELALLVIFSFSSVTSFAAPSAQSYCNSATPVQDLPRISESAQQALLAIKTQVDHVVISKDLKELFLIKNSEVIKSYHVAFGLNPVGHKQFSGDMKTPEGIYYLESKNPRSAYYLGLKVSYPNNEDLRRAAKAGKSAGGMIMIHGWPVDKQERSTMENGHPQMNWTQGCIAVTDQEIFEIYQLVPVGTPIEICPMGSR